MRCRCYTEMLAAKRVSRRGWRICHTHMQLLRQACSLTYMLGPCGRASSLRLPLRKSLLPCRSIRQAGLTFAAPRWPLCCLESVFGAGCMKRPLARQLA